MPKVKKRAGHEEEFDKAKVERSMRKAGATETAARKIADGMKPRAGMATSEIRKHVADELRRNEPDAAKRYEAYRKE
jgi:2-phosphoglycerate kinase